MAEVRVSVIVPVYNAEDTIRDCLDDITGQTLRETEIICVDDGSSDGSVSVIEEYRQKDGRIRVIRQENQGAGAARNTGMKEAQGEYLCFLDADDRFEPEMLEEAWKRCCETGADTCVWSADCFDAGTGEVQAYTSAFDKRYIPQANPFDPASDEAHETDVQRGAVEQTVFPGTGQPDRAAVPDPADHQRRVLCLLGAVPRPPHRDPGQGAGPPAEE